ncbi:autotransporter-associated beta strand repeat-containing protein [Sphingomonas sp. MMS24-J13]|uniref:autotransporter-associated beta strand repeat-containing protein n=1 Tax=Sphingomonas sp. MMS24-J13 TaxID=3238686 RepID=UPI00384FB916
MKSRVHLLASTAAVIIAAVSSSFASAQTTVSVVNGNGGTGQFVTTNNALATTNSNVTGPTVSVGNSNSQTVYTNFRTVGGSGSGGGAGLGGVFFIDTGASLSLTNVSFANNTVTGGQGGGVKVNSAASIAFSVAGATTDASAYVQYNTGVGAHYDALTDSVQVSSLTLSAQNTLVGVGSGVGVGQGASYSSAIGDTTINADGSETLTLTKALTLTDGNGVNKVTRTTLGGGLDAWNFSSNSATAVQSGMTIVGNGIPTGVIVDQVNRDANNNITSITAKDANGNAYLLPANQSFYVVNAQTYDFSRVQSSVNGNTNSNTLISTGPLAGFAVGMTVTGTGVPAGTKVTAVSTDTDPETGGTITTVTLSNNVNLTTATDIKASFNPLVSNSGNAVLSLSSTAGFAVGQTVSGIGIPVGTKIVAINGNDVTLSSALGTAAVNAINNSNLLLTIDPVVASAPGSVKLTSVSGFRVGDAITGTSIPANARITGIDASTNTITYVVDPALASANAGGSLNGLKAPGTVGANGSNGQTGTSFGATFDNGEGSPGSNATSGKTGTNAAGGNGGNGGNGSNGSATNKTLITGLALDTASLVADFLSTADDAAGLFTLPSVAGDIAHTVVDAAHVVFDTTQLVAWQIAEKQGLVALGGSGGQGGNGGDGTAYFGGGMGGTGGHGGNGAESNSIGGAGGAGGSGGAGGFGAGGGNGGAGGAAGNNGIAGSAGAGGTAGFGGGTGSSAGQSGQGGSGYGGAIFVRNGGTLTITGNSIFQNNAALAGSSSNGGASGSSAGADLFMMTGSTVNLRPGVGSTITFYDSIADDSSASIGGSIAAGQGASLNIGGGGTVQLFGTNTYTGATNISGGTLEAQDGTGINPFSQIQFSGSGTIGNNLSLTTAGVLLSGGTITRAVGTGPTNVYFSGSGGFAATSNGLVVNLGSLNGGVGPTLVWGAGGFVPTTSTLLFGSDATDATGTVTFKNAINLNGGSGQIAVYHNSGNSAAYDALMTGAIANGTLNVNDTGFDGTLVLSAQNSLNGVTLNNGTLTTVNGSQIGRLMNTSAGGYVTINGGTLQLGGAEKLTTVNVALGGSLLAAGAINAGAINNAGIAGFASTLNASSINNSGVIGLMGATAVSGLFNNQSGGIVRQLADTTAGNVVNDGTWSLVGDLTTGGTVVNNGEIDVIGTLANGTETAATRTIHTAGLAGGATGVINVGGTTGTLGNTLVVDQSGNSIYAGVVTGAGSLAKTGTGILTLTGANTFTGGLAINAGMIDTTGGGTLADNLAISVAQGAAFNVGTNDTVGSIQNAGALTTTADLNVATIGNSGTAVVYAGLNTTGDVVNTVDGNLRFAGSSNASIGGNLANAGSVKASGVLSVAGTVDNAATGTISLSSASTPTFGSLINSGTVTANAALTVTGAYTQNAGTLNANANIATGSFSGLGGVVNLAGGTSFAINQTKDGAYLGSVVGLGVVNKAGAATLVLAGDAGSFAPAALNVQQGGVVASTANVLGQALVVKVLSDGGLGVSADQSIATLANDGTVALGADLTTSGGVTNNGVIVLTGEGAVIRTIHTPTFAGASSGQVLLGGADGTVANTLVIDQSGNSTYAGTFSGAGSLTKTGAGTLNLTGASSFTGGLAVNAGTLDTTGGGTLADTLAVTVAQGAAYTVGTADVVGSIQNAGTLTANADLGVGTIGNTGAATVNAALVTSGDVTNAVGANLTFAASSNALIGGNLANAGTVYGAGVLSVAGTVDNASTGTVTLAATSTPTFGTLVNAGTITANAALTVTGAYVQNAGTLNANANLSTGSFSGQGGSVILAGGTSFAINQINDGAYLGSVVGLGVVNKSGAATLALAGDVGSFAPAALNVQQGVVVAQTANVLGQALAVNVAQQGALALAADQSIATLTNEGAVALGADLTTSGGVVNNGLTVLTGDGAVTRTIHTPTFAGASTGNVALGGIDGTVANSLVLDQSGDSTYAGIFSGAGSLTKTGAGTLTLTGANTFVGGLTVNAGAIDTTGGGTFADTLAINIAQGAALVVGTADVVGAVTNAGTLTANADYGVASLANSGNAALNAKFAANGDVANTGTIAFNGSSTAIGGTLTNNGTATVANQFVTSAVVNAASLSLQSGSVTHVTGNVTNSGQFASAGTLVVDGQLNNVQGGTAALGGVGTSLGSLANAGTVSASAPLGVTGAVVNSGAIALATGGTVQFGSLVNSGTVTSNDALSVAGSYQQNAGTLTANAGLATGSLSGAGGRIVLANASQYVVNQTVDGTFAGSISGNGKLVKTGAATLTLSGGNDSIAPAALAINQGGVTVQQAGALDNALSVNVATGGTLTLLSDQTIRDLGGNGTLSIATNNLTLNNGGTFTGAITGTGSVKVASGTFTFNGAGTSSVNSLAVSGSTVNVGPNTTINTQTLSVANGLLNLQGTVVANSTTITNNGVLHLGNGIDVGQAGAGLGTLNSGTTLINGGGMLTGNGTVTGNTTVGGTSGGTIAPGNSPGVMTFTNLTYGNQGVAAMQIDGANGAGVAGGNDLVIVSGTLTLQAGSTLAISKSSSTNGYELPLGKGIQLFRYGLGRVNGAFGSVTKTGFTGNLAFNLSNGTIYGLGSYTPDAFAAAVSTTATGAAAMKATFVTNAGGVAQYYGGNLIGAVSTALGSGPAAVTEVLKRWSPDAYAGILDEARSATLNNLPEIGGYTQLQPGRVFATGSVEHDRIDGRQEVGYSQNKFHNTGFSLGFAGDLRFAEVSVSYTRHTGGFNGDAIQAKVNGNQFGAGVSVPVTADQALRLVARGVYGDFTAHGSRGVIGGTANFGDVRSHVYTYGGGFEYARQSNRIWIDASAEILGVHQTLGSFTETASTPGGLDLFGVRRTTENRTVAKLDGKLGYALTPMVTAYVKAGYLHEFGGANTAIVADGAIDPITVTVDNPGLAKDRANAGLGLQVNLSQKLQLNADATGGTQGSYRIGGGVKLRF